MLCVSFRYLNIHICNARIIIVVAVVDMRHFRFAESSVCQSIWHIQLVAFLLSGRVIRARFYSRSLASVDRCRIANVLSGTIGLQLNRCNCDIRKVKSLFWTYQNPLSDCRMSQDCWWYSPLSKIRSSFSELPSNRCLSRSSIHPRKLPSSHRKSVKKEKPSKKNFSSVSNVWIIHKKNRRP